MEDVNFIILFYLDVPPTFTKKIESSYFFFVGQNYKLTCDAVGGPEPTIKWYHDDEEITNGDHLMMTPNGKTLMLKDVRKAQNGVYKCEAENRKAKVEATGVIKAFGKCLIFISISSAAVY